MGKKRLSFMGKLLWLINIFIAAALLASYLSYYVNPEITTVFAFLGLAYLYLLGLNIIFALYWLVRGKRKWLLSSIVILTGFNPLINHIQLMPGREAPRNESILKVVSYNVQNLAHSNLGYQDAGIRNKIFGFLGSQDADIVCIQEFAAKGRDTTKVYDDIKTLTQFPECYHVNYFPDKHYRIHSLLLLSKLPYHNSGSLSIQGDDHNFGGYIDFVQDADTVRIYNLHLESIRLHHDDYQFVEDVSKGQTESGSFGEGSKSILRKLQHAYQIRAQQTAVVVQSLEKCPYPVIVCGDFNDTPLSYTYHQIRGEREDAFVNAGFGLGNTFAGKLPPIRIDFVFYSDLFTSYDFQVHKTQLSDHYPISVYLGR